MVKDILLTLPKSLENENEETLNKAGGDEPVPPADIISFNELRSCADLFRLFETGKLEIQPDFQRDVVWKSDEQTRFIDSLVKQLPIPSMCFSLDYKTQKWKVIDGLQRMSSIVAFLGSSPWRLRDLDDIHPLLRGATNVSLRDGNSDRERLYSTVLDVSIPITVLRCDYSQRSHMQYLFTIFHRLNSGGVRLNNQEIRNCIYSGDLNNSLKRFDAQNPQWLRIRRRIWGSFTRFRSVELLLRAIAFADRYEQYDGNFAKFLNEYMHEKMDVSGEAIELLEVRLAEMSQLALLALGQHRTAKVSMTFIEALLVAILRNIETLRNSDESQMRERFDLMVEEEEFADAAKYAISSQSNVITRMNAAVSIFGPW